MMNKYKYKYTAGGVFYSYCGIFLIIIYLLLTSSCGTSRLTEEQVKHRDNIDYELDKLYLEYSYQRDSLIIEFYKK